MLLWRLSDPAEDFALLLTLRDVVHQTVD